MGEATLQAIGLVLAGVLAGEEFIVRYGVAPALRTLPDLAHLQARQALVRRLRIVVPALMVPTVLVALAVAAVGAGDAGTTLRWERIDVIRSGAAVLAFGCLAAAIAQRVG